MPKVKWAVTRADKADLERGVQDWVAKKTGIPNVRFSYLHHLTTDDLTLLAMAMGYKPPELREAIIRKRFAREAEECALATAKWKARKAVQDGTAIPLPGPSTAES
jgi:hypothetical protein